MDDFQTQRLGLLEIDVVRASALQRTVRKKGSLGNKMSKRKRFSEMYS